MVTRLPTANDASASRGVALGLDRHAWIPRIGTAGRNGECVGHVAGDLDDRVRTSHADAADIRAANLTTPASDGE
jgi:hypothetical protein